MNLVAHQLLSFHQPEIQIGNLYGEIVRGKDYENYPPGIKKGILLHRRIDSFTDQHTAVKNSTQKFHERFGKYAPVIVDVLYDYLLISDWKKYSPQPYEEFVDECYQLFRSHFEEFPPALQLMINHLLQYDWFRNYATIEGIGQTLQGISRRSKFPNNISRATEEIQLYLPDFQKDFNLFFPELTEHCRLFLNDGLRF